MTEQTNNGKKVNWIVFAWAMGIVIIAFGWVFNIVAGINAKVDGFTNDNVEMKMDIREIKTNVAWIMEALKQDGYQINKK